MKKIHLNQLGYRPADKKAAVVTIDADDFAVVHVCDETTAYRGKLGAAFADPASGDIVRHADFSPLCAKGEYILVVGDATSYPFAIADAPYAKVRRALLDFFHYQKCGVDLDCGSWSHRACHTGPALIYGTEETKNVSGGWHDAGDYGRYIVPAAMTVADLLLAYELSPQPDRDIPAIVGFELEWMLKMQDEASGGVYHKVSCRTFDSLDEMPEDECQELVIMPPTLAATADLAGTFALASRFYPEKKELLLAAAARAWDWCTENPHSPPYVNPPDIRTGAYGDMMGLDPQCLSNRLFAACELFAATGDERYHDYMKQSGLYSGLGWHDLGGYGLFAYLCADRRHSEGDSAPTRGRDPIHKTDPALASRMKERLHAECAAIMERHRTDGYGISLANDYRWGSNMDVANNAQMLIFGSLIFAGDAAYPTDGFDEAVLAHFHYLLGRNPLSRSYITGFGANAVARPHHRPSVARGKAIPGMLVGGPNMHSRTDPDLDAACAGFPPAKRHTDQAGSYSSNEVAIYWNSAAYFVAAMIMGSQL